MIRRPVARAVFLAACLCLLWGGSSLLRASATAGASPAGAQTVLAATAAMPGVDSASTVVAASAATAAESAASIPLPPSAYPGMVGLATAALSVWRYRRRRH